MRGKLALLLVTALMLVLLTACAKEEYITIQGEQYSSKLEELELHNVAITDEETLLLTKMTKLKKLTLNCDNISDFTPLSEMINLTEISLFMDASQSGGLSPLSRLTNLKEFQLILSDCDQITSLATLRGLSNLTNLFLHTNYAEPPNKPIIMQEIQSLENALPDLEISKGNYYE